MEQDGEAVSTLEGVVQIARKALEPPDLLEEAGEEHSGAPLGLAAPAGPSQHWSAVRCGCIEGVLATAILAGQHANVWEAASMLLREHYRSGTASVALHCIHARAFAAHWLRPE